MNYITIVELAELSGVPGNSVILYLSMFEEFFREHKLVDGIKKIPEEKVGLIRAIHDLHHGRKMAKQEILDKVRKEYPWETPKAEQSDPAVELGTKIDRLSLEMETLNTSGIMRLVQAVERLADMAQSLPGALASMASPSQPVDMDAGTVLDQLLTTRQDDQEDDPEILRIIERSKADIGLGDMPDSEFLDDTRGNIEDGGGDEAVMELQSMDELVDTIIGLHQRGKTSSEIKSILRQPPGTNGS